jgi:hypothetical protein
MRTDMISLYALLLHALCKEGIIIRCAVLRSSLPHEGQRSALKDWRATMPRFEQGIQIQASFERLKIVLVEKIFLNVKSSRHQIAYLKAREGFHLPYCTALSQQYSVTTLRFLSCLHSPGLRCSCCNVVRFLCDLEACNLVTAARVLVILKMHIVK